MTGLILEILLLVSFANDYKPFLDNVSYFLLLSLFIPIYYAEFNLGFVLGITYTFGTILPTVFVVILAGIGFFDYRFTWLTAETDKYSGKKKAGSGGNAGISVSLQRRQSSCNFLKGKK